MLTILSVLLVYMSPDLWNTQCNVPISKHSVLQKSFLTHQEPEFMMDSIIERSPLILGHQLHIVSLGWITARRRIPMNMQFWMTGIGGICVIAGCLNLRLCPVIMNSDMKGFWILHGMITALRFWTPGLLHFFSSPPPFLFILPSVIKAISELTFP